MFLAPFNWWAYLSGDGPILLQIFCVIFDLFLLGAALDVFKRLLAALKFGRTRLYFRSFPYRPGRPLEVDFAPNQFERMHVRLRFIQERYETEQTRKGTVTRQVAREHAVAEQTLSPAETLERVPICFDIPDNPDWFTQLTPSPGVHYWLLDQGKGEGKGDATLFCRPAAPRPSPPYSGTQQRGTRHAVFAPTGRSHKLFVSP